VLRSDPDCLCVSSLQSQDMEWRGRSRRRAVVVVMMATACLIPALPAGAHNGEHPVLIASNQGVQSYVVSAWTSERFSMPSSSGSSAVRCEFGAVSG